MKDRLKDPVLQFVVLEFLTLLAIIIPVLLGLKELYGVHIPPYVLVILAILAVLICGAPFIPVPAVRGWVKGKIEAAQSFFRSTWGRRLLAFVLLLGLVILECIRLRLPLPLWSIRLYVFFVQILLLLWLAFQILDLRRTSEGSSSELFPLRVDATKEEGVDTGLFLRSGDQIRIVATGEVSINRGQPWIQPNGIVTRGGEVGTQYRVVNTHLDEDDRGGVVGALIGWIGEDRDRSSFFVGEECTKTADRSGRLYLGVNDRKECYSDNTDQSGNPTFFTVCVELLR